MVFAIADAGPLVAWLDAGEPAHQWTIDAMKRLTPPLLLCEPVLAEAMYILRRFPKAQDKLLTAIERDAFRIAFTAAEHIGELRTLLAKYHDVPMSLADACIVRMTEIHDRHAVLTFDSDFAVYRKHGRTPLDLIRPGRAPL